MIWKSTLPYIIRRNLCQSKLKSYTMLEIDSRRKNFARWNVCGYLFLTKEEYHLL